MIKDDKIYIAGHSGLVGSALIRRLQDGGCNNLLTASHSELDLCRQADVEEFLNTHKPDIIIIAAAKVGGIHANRTYPADFMYDNLSIALNLIHGAHQADIQRVIFLGSSCIYPRLAPQPMKEDALLSGPLEHTNEAYAVAKIAGLKLCQHYRAQHHRLYHSVMPTNLYGLGDNYNPENSHVLPALIRKFHEAKTANKASVTIWGSGLPRREFLHVDDCADAVIHLLDITEPPDWVNIGYGEDITIAELAGIIKDVVGFTGRLEFDTGKPDGPPRKLLDSNRMRSLGWSPRISLRLGIERTYADFVAELNAGHLRQ